MKDFDHLQSSEVYSSFKKSELPTGKYDTYFEAYDELFAKFKGKDVTFVEVGIMGGGALEAWKRYFGKGSRIIGVDLNPELSKFFNGLGFEIHIGDQADPAFWADFFKKVGPIDILLDDGGHTNIQQWTTFKAALPQVNDGGMIVIEDIHTSYMMGFGNPSELSFISRAKACVDEINQRSCRIEARDRSLWKPSPLLEGLEIAKYVSSMSFYESIVAFSIMPSKCRVPKEISFGSLERLPKKSSPEDYRYKGIEDASMMGSLPALPKKSFMNRALRKAARFFRQ